MATPSPTLRELFETAQVLPLTERGTYLATHCDNPTLRARVENMLAADALGNSQVLVHTSGSLFEAIGDVHTESAEPPAGSRIGSFTLLEKLGEGGSSIVFRAEREQAGVRQTVALKLLRNALYTHEEQRNFRRERLALTQLRHPGIARLIEGDVTETGIPYIALELIDGAPITAHARGRRLDLRQRLQLFVSVCRAVEAAHRALIVHRDLKPSNVLVTAEGDVKLLDFGIAKLLDGDAPADSTRTQHVAMTPAYAAPEQFTNATITTATDVYSLGVLLGELVTGVRREHDDISTPSSRISANVEEGILPGPVKTVRRQLRGDLDNIVIKATAKEPEQRYASAGAFGDDIERYLAREPVVAHPPSSGYRARKFIARHKVGVITTAFFLLAVIGALGVALWQADMAREQTRIAREQAQRAEAVRDFLVGVFQQVDPDLNRGQPITAHQLLDRASQQIGKGVYDRAVEADAAANLATLAREMGEQERAASLLTQALPAAEDPSTPRDIRARVLIGVAEMEVESGGNESAIAHARLGLSLLDVSTKSAAEFAAQAHNIIAHGLINTGDWGAAETLLRASLKEDAIALGDRSDALISEWTELGAVLANVREFDESQAAFERAIEISRLVWGANSNRVAHTLNELSNMLSDKGDFAGAEHALRQALQIRIQTIGPTARDTMVEQSNLLTTVEMEGRLAESLSQRLQLIETASAAQTQPLVMAIIYTHTGSDLRDLGRLDEAEPMLRKAIATFDKNSVSSVSALRDLGVTQVLQGRYDDGDTSLRSALAILQQHEGSNIFKTASLQIELGKLLRLQHRAADAVLMLTSASDVYEHADAIDRDRPRAAAALSEAQLDAGDVPAALATAQRSLLQARKILPAQHYLLGDSLFALARVELAMHQADAAEPLLREAMAVRSPPFPVDDLRTLEVQVALVNALDQLARNNEANTLGSAIEPLLRASRSPYAQELQKRMGAPF
jgi:eukaryotic-like serine/threonine-protein kinase